MDEIDFNILSCYIMELKQVEKMTFNELEEFCHMKQVATFAKFRVLKLHMTKEGITDTILYKHQQYSKLLKAIKNEMNQIISYKRIVKGCPHDIEMASYFETIPCTASFYIGPATVYDKRDCGDLIISREEVNLECGISCHSYSFSVGKEVTGQIAVYVEIIGRPYGYYCGSTKNGQVFLKIYDKMPQIGFRAIVNVKGDESEFMCVVHRHFNEHLCGKSIKYHEETSQNQ